MAGATSSVVYKLTAQQWSVDQCCRNLCAISECYTAAVGTINHTGSAKPSAIQSTQQIHLRHYPNLYHPAHREQ